jgi:CubicO group peptidase (beta-lactamase class C family)
MVQRLGLLLCLLNFCSAHAQPAARSGASVKDKGYRRAIAQGARFMDSLRLKQHIPGLSVTVAVRGKTVWQEGFGFADLENLTPVTATSRFRIGSVSKSFTSVALAQLVEQGKLDLDVPIQQYVPGFPVKRYPLTLRQLAGHTAGIRHYQGPAEGDVRTHYASVTASLAIFQHDSLLFEPGTRYSYSSYGWVLISAAIEHAAGQSFVSYMQQRVFQPLGMSGACPDVSDSIIAGRTGYYQWSRRRQAVLVAPWEDVSYKWAGGGFLATSGDLARLGSALLANTFLRPETTQLLFTSQHTRDGQATDYGLGWRVGTDSRGRRIVHHGGTAWGGRAFLLLYPDQNLVIAITTNLGNPDFAEKELEKLADGFIGDAKNSR